MSTETISKILFVDDDTNVLAAMQRNLRKHFTLDIAAGPDEALQTLRTKGPYAVIVADMSMPIMNGAELLEAVRAFTPDTVRVMLTGNADQRTAVEAVNRGNVFRFLSKPCAPDTLIATLETALKQHELIATEKALLNQTLNGSLQVLTDILAMLDPEAFGQAQLRRTTVREVALKLGIASTWELEIAALLAEIGLVTLPPAVREKVRLRQSLSTNERQLVDRIPEFSARLLGSIPRLEPVSQIVLYQNKNFDGSGFPVDDVKRLNIPIGARVLRVVESAVRMHRKGTPVGDIISAILAGPEHYDATVAHALSACSSALRAKPKATATGMRSVPLIELAPGHVLVADIVTMEGTIVLAAGATLNATQIQRLRNFAALNPIVEPISVDIPPAIAEASA
ncbi:MAG: response regulator [Verrucomicrobia bacterium]|nr:response regulator [Verrucomicrobiota bacterium]